MRSEVYSTNSILTWTSLLTVWLKRLVNFLNVNRWSRIDQIWHLVYSRRHRSVLYDQVYTICKSILACIVLSRPHIHSQIPKNISCRLATFMYNTYSQYRMWNSAYDWCLMYLWYLNYFYIDFSVTCQAQSKQNILMLQIFNYNYYEKWLCLLLWATRPISLS